MDDSLSQLILLLLIGLGWVVKAVAEQRKRREEAKRPKPTPEAYPEATPDPIPVHVHVEPEPRRHGGRVRRPHLSELAPDTGETARTVTRAEATADRRQEALRILSAGTPPVSIRLATRAGILWSEVLGPPRAVRGPHRPPTFTRGRR